MARLPDSEIERLKQAVSIEAVGGGLRGETEPIRERPVRALFVSR